MPHKLFYSNYSQMKTKLTLVKIGGQLIDNAALLNETLRYFAKLEGAKLLVHGGGKLATNYAERLGVASEFIDGRRKTDQNMRDVAVMVYAGLINKKIVGALQGLNCNSVGLCGADFNTIKAKKRPSKPIDFGYVGDITAVDTSIITSLLNKKITPVFSPITCNEKGDLLNTNADTIATQLAIYLSQEFDIRLIYCFDQKGVLADFSNSNSLITEIASSELDQLISKNIIHAGMIPKLSNGFEALANNVREVALSDHLILKNWEQPKTTLKHTLK